MTEKTKQMTQVAALETAIEVLKEFGVTDEHMDAITVIQHILDKRRAPRSRKPKAETVAFREELIAVLSEAEEPITNAELTAAMRERLDDPEVKPQKIANNIRVLEKDGMVVRHRSEKPSGKDTFSLA